MCVIYGEDWWNWKDNKEVITMASSEQIAKKIVAEINARKSRGYDRYPCYYDKVFYKHIDGILITSKEDILKAFGWKKLLT